MSNQIIFGRQPILEALEANKNIEKVFIQQKLHGENIGEILKNCRIKNISISYVPPFKLDKMVKGNHQGIVALMSPVDFVPIQSMIDFVFSEGRNPFFVVVEGITDTRNLGAIVRSALCMNADAIILNTKNTAPINADVVKTSAGAVHKINWCKEKSIHYILDILYQNGIKTFASDLQASQKIEDLNLTEPMAIVLGSEDEGISESTRKACTQTFKIPMSAAFDSLNVSVAAGICFYETYKQRNVK